MKPIWLLASLWVVLCLGGAIWAAHGLQGELAAAASAKLAANGGTPEGLLAMAAGQSVVLKGTASRQSDIDRIIKQIGEELRLEGVFGKGTQFNPVRRVINEIRLVMRPEGWGVLAATGTAVHLRGVAASEDEANRLGVAVRSSGQLGRDFNSDLSVDGEVFIESDKLENTIQTVPALTSKAIKRGLLAVTIWGQKWTELEVAKPAEVLRREVLALGLPETAWESNLFTEVERVRSAREAYLSAEQEKQRLESLAPGHVVMAVRGSQILLRGELGSPQACELLVDAIRLACKDRVVIDELAHSSHRKPEVSSKLLATTVPKLADGLLVKVLAVGTPDSGWKTLDLDALDVENTSTITQPMLPAGLDLRLALPDVTTGLTWVNSIDAAPMQRDVAKMPPYFMLTAVGNHVYLRGAVAEEAVRTQVEAAARRLYSARELEVDVRLDGTCQSIGQALQTLATLPPPPAMETAGFIAFAFGGDEWRRKPAQARLLEPLGLQQSGMLPDGLSVNLFMPDMLAIAPAVRAHLGQLSLGPPGIPLQSASQP
ncbi:MAG: hypothetical protein JWO08_4506 [Verrucomicrobiaceae bacterium]|nr:hypothetical protein [Verrucomicrobiaceae bacterium]